MQMIQKPLSNYNHSRQILAQKPLFWTLFAIAGLPKRLLLYHWSVTKRFKILFQWEKVKWHIKFRLNRKREIKCDTNYFGSPFSDLESAMIYEALIQVLLVLLQHPEKAIVYFVLAVISGFLISSTWYWMPGSFNDAVTALGEGVNCSLITVHKPSH